MDIKKFWLVKSMEDFTEAEWEAICLKCGKCCVLKDFNNGIARFSNRACDGLDLKTGRCTRYDTRICADCVKVDMNLIRDLPELLPETCAYRMLFEGKGLPDYHPLITDDKDSVKKAKQTVLDWPDIHSTKNLHDDLMQLNIKSSKEKWSLDYFEEEADKLMEKYPIKFVAQYPIPTKKKGNTTDLKLDYTNPDTEN